MIDTSILQDRRFVEFRSANFALRRNVPLDCRFIVSSLTNLNNEIPLNLRYNGLIFYVVSTTRNNGTDNVAMGQFYCFDDDLNNPQPLRNKLVYNYEMIFYDDTSVTNYTSNVVPVINKSYAIPGRIIWFKKLQIAIVYEGKSGNDHIWRYLTGVYQVATDAIFDSLPSTWKQQSRLVLVNTTRKIIKNNLTLSTELIELPSTDPVPSATTNPNDQDRYYYWNNRLYFYIGGKMFLVSDGMWYNTSQNISIGKTVVTHNLSSNYILVQSWLKVPAEYRYIPSGYNFGNVNLTTQMMQYDIDYEVTSENTLTIFSQLATTISIIVFTKFKS
jgi:hypothetical protein